ncbi:hypothetical protein [Superficieibacter sp. 1612_C1]|uniref:hypothetical protein n=1 Tax=Superficieibacter sp. 1612_C1 TaxID=2780382 RepID=UPI001D162726|nr:hypothetical protein [Superficieibacter sp. 1612_C1]
MIDIYAFATPDSIKVPVALEELCLKYDLHAVNVRKGEQKSAEFLALNALVPQGVLPVFYSQKHR